MMEKTREEMLKKILPVWDTLTEEEKIEATKYVLAKRAEREKQNG